MAPIQHLGNIDKRKRTSQQVAFGFFSFLSYLVVVILFVILGFIILKGASVISWDFLTQAPQEGMTSGGIFPAIVGTLYLVIGSSLISFPIGIMSGIYMNEYATNGKLIRFIRIMTNNLSGVPSVVFGLFGMSLFVSTLGWGDSIIAGSFTLALMSLPLIIRTTEEALKSIDDSFRHGVCPERPLLSFLRWPLISCRNCRKVFSTNVWHYLTTYMLSLQAVQISRLPGGWLMARRSC